MIAMRVVEMAIHEVVHMVAMGHLCMTTTRTVDMTRVVPGAFVTRRASVGICRCYFERAFIDVVAVNVMQMAIVQVVRVTIMFDRRMATAWTMLMRVTLDFRAGSHIQTPFAKHGVDLSRQPAPIIGHRSRRSNYPRTYGISRPFWGERGQRALTYLWSDATLCVS
jgi:hypothetical protein